MRDGPFQPKPPDLSSQFPPRRALLAGLAGQAAALQALPGSRDPPSLQDLSWASPGSGKPPSGLRTDRRRASAAPAGMAFTVSRSGRDDPLRTGRLALSGLPRGLAAGPLLHTYSAHALLLALKCSQANPRAALTFFYLRSKVLAHPPP